MNKTLLTKFVVTVLFVLLACFSQKTYASHAMGADLTYECVGGNTYKVRLSFYRDCIGIAAPTNVYVSITSASCGQNLGVTCYPIPGTGVEVTPLCPSATSTCSTPPGTFTGIQEWIYEGVITLPQQCTDWVFGYDLCCRNAAITTITNPGISTFHIYASLNNTVSPCNSSPTFSNKPVPFACQGQELCFNHGAFDPDGDSLVYSLITPLQDASTTVNYIAPYSANNPLNSVPALQFNAATGDICMTPQQLQVTVMAVLVQEYRNGVLIGSVERDIQITVITCNNNLPTLSGINGTNSYSATICANQEFCFDIFSDDPDAAQNAYVSWDNGISTGTFTVNSSQHPTGHFCWTPANADIGGTYCFTVRVHDDACPIYGSQIYSYCLTVIGVTANAGPDQAIACNDLATLYATGSGGTPPYTYHWSNGSTQPGITVGPGTYVVTVSDGQCSATDTVVVTNAFMPIADFTNNEGCVNTAIHFIDQSTVPGGTIILWNWNFGDGQTSNQQNPTHIYASGGTYNVTLIIQTNFGCIDTIVQPVTINPIPVADFTFPNGCMGNTIQFNNTTQPPAVTYNWNWNLGNGQSSNGQNPITTYPDSGTYTVTLIAGDSLGCADTVTHQITIFPGPIADFTFTGGSTCLNGTVTLINTSTGGATFNWNLGNGQTSNQQNPVVTYSQPGNYDVTLVVTSANGCIDSITQTVTIFPLPVPDAGPDQHVCLNGSVTLVASGGVTYLWSNGTATDVNTITPTANGTYTVTVTDANGCSAQDQVTVFIDPLPVPTVSPDQSICAGESVTLTASGGSTYLWNPTGDNTSSITVTPSNSTVYAVNVTDANGCTGTGFVSVAVHQLPAVDLQNAFVCAGQTTSLDAGNPGSTYLWTPAGQTTQTISISGPGTYGVVVTNGFGCTSSDSSVISQGGTITNNLSNVSFCAGGSAILDAGNPGNTYLWTPGGQTTQTISVNSSGAYNVTITDANGCSGTISTTVNVHPLPQVDFTPNDVCINDAMDFFDISSVNGGTITSWQWDFGDGNVSQQQNPVHYYAVPGNYNVTFTVTSNFGCVNSINKSFNVFPLPTANFNFTNNCVGNNINFTNASSTSVGNIVGWNWNFGDGSTSSQQNPVHQFAAEGTYTVTLAVATGGGCTDTISKQITVFPLPVADFTTLPVCLNTQTSFNNNSTVPNGGIMGGWLWNFGDATTSNAQNPAHGYPNAGTFNVSLIVTSTDGCSDTVSKQVIVNPLPIANAGIDKSVCYGDSAVLSASGGSVYEWNPGNINTQNITVNPLVTTDYGVLVTDANGCQDYDSVRVIIKSLPIADAGNDAAVCNGQSATLTANGGVSYLWSPGGESTASISVNPTTSTTYSVLVTGANGCKAVDSASVLIHSLPPASAGPDVELCEGATATLIASGGITYLWLPGGDTSSVIYVNPSVFSSYIVQVTDSNGCRNADTVDVNVSPTPVVDLQPTFICAGNSTVIDAGNPGFFFLWTPNGETTQTITVSQAGTYGVIVTSVNGCQTSASSTVTVGGTGIAGNLGNVTFCAGDNAQLDAGNVGSTYSWSTGSTAQTISVNTAGSYTVTVTDPTGCSSEFVGNAVVNPLPNAAFAALPSCLSSVTQFNDSSTIASGNLISWSWYFGDGTFSSAQNPSHLFPAAGNYNVSLVVTSGNGCTDSISHIIAISPEPFAAFGSNSSCFGSNALFTDLSTISNGTVALWNWDFGDGSTSSDQNPSHAYGSAGTYTVTLIAASAGGCADTVSNSITINPSPAADFRASTVCNKVATDFTDLSTMANGVIDGYTWNFGDGNTSNLQNPSHVYNAAGTYNVSLIVTSDLGCADTATQAVRVAPLPLVNFTAPAVCLDNPSVFTDASSVTGGTLSNWYWEFGDGSSSNTQNPLHIYNTDGSFSVLFVATSDEGCRDSATQAVVVFPLPVAAFDDQNVCLTNATQLLDSSYVSSGSITNWSWNLGDGSSSTDQNPTHTYTLAGTYNVSLTATTNHGCTDTVSQSINVFPLPDPQFNAASVCFGIGTGFYNQSTIPGGGIVNCSWNFGDGATDTVQNPIHNYGAEGTFNVTMTATTSQGCSASITQPVDVLGLPRANFMGGDVCMNIPTSFTDLSTAAAGGFIVGWNWDLGDSTTSASKDPLHIYGAPGTYNVLLTVTSDLGCSDMHGDSVRVFISPEPMITSSTECASSSVAFYNVADSTNANGSTLVWDFGDGITSSSNSPVHVYTSPGSYNVTLAVTNLSGCRATALATIDVNPQPDPGFTNGTACSNTSLQFDNTSTITSGNISGYTWNFGDGTPVISDENPAHTFQTAGTYTVTLTAISDLGCTDSISYQIVVNPQPVTQFVTAQAAGCGPLLVQFNDSSYISSGAIASWWWDFGDGQNDSIQDPAHTYQYSGSYTVSLTATSDSGCTQTYSINNMITVYPEPDAMFAAEPPSTNILNPLIQFNNLSTGASLNYWTFGDGSTSSDESPLHTYADTGYYHVTLYVQNSFGCYDTASTDVYIAPITTFYIPNTFTPNSDGTNDVFTVKGINILSVELTIYNRWGDMVYTASNAVANPWTGSVINSMDQAKQDVYVYDAVIKDVFGVYHHKSGRVNLVR